MILLFIVWLYLSSASRLSVCPVVQLRKNPPSPLNRGKRISGTKEKFRKSGKKMFTCSPQSHSLPMQFCIVCYGHIMFVDIAGSSIVGPPISPSPTTGSFGSGLTIANFLQCSLIYIAWILRQLSFSLYVLLQQIRNILSFKVKHGFHSFLWATQFTLINHLKHSTYRVNLSAYHCILSVCIGTDTGVPIDLPGDSSPPITPRRKLSLPNTPPSGIL